MKNLPFFVILCLLLSGHIRIKANSRDSLTSIDTIGRVEDAEVRQISVLSELERVMKQMLPHNPEAFVDEFLPLSHKITPQGYHELDLLLIEALEIIPEDKHPNQYAKLLLRRGGLLQRSGYNYVEAYQCLREALRFFNPDIEPEYTARTYSELGSLWRNLGEHENALSCCAEAEKIYRWMGDEKQVLNMRLNACIIYTEQKESQKLLQVIQEDLPNAKTTNERAYLLSFLGNYYFLENNMDSAYICYDEVLDLINKDATVLMEANLVLANLGEISLQRKEYEKARIFLEESLPYEHSTNRVTLESQTYDMLSEVYEHLGDSDKALALLRKSVQMKNSIAIEDKASEVQRMRSHSELMNYQQELEITSQKAKTRQARSLSAILCLIIVLITVLFILFYINRKKQLKDFETKQLAQQLQLESLEYERQIEEKEREMAASQILLTEKSKVLDHLLKTFKPFYDANQMPEELWREMKMFVTSNLKKDDEWEKSTIHFEKVHPDFFKKLKEQAPDLGESELRVAAYIRIGMPTKQIANMLAIDYRSVITSRYRIKKKLNLEKEVSLDDFIRNV